MANISVRIPNKPSKPSSYIRSQKPFISWPAIPNEKSALLLAMLYQLEMSQWWSPERLRKTQLFQALNLLSHARKTVPYYRDKLSFLEGVSELDELLWSQIPILTRTDLQQFEDQLLSTSIPTSHGSISEIRTSGSTGRPVRVKRTETFLIFHKVLNLREHHWLNQNPAATLMVIRSVQGLEPGKIKVQKSWGPPYNLLYNTNRSILMDIATDVETQLANLLKYKPDYLITYPSNLSALLQHGKPSMLSQLNLHQVRTLSETITDDLRKEVREKLGAKLVDVYSAHEVSTIALQCPKHDHYHVQSENVLVEVLNSDGSTCTPGEIGEVVVTSLHNFAMPLIRYDLGDYAEVGNICDCGRGLPVLKRILGRARNMVIMPDGTPRWPTVRALQVADVAPISQIQVVQHTVKEMEARLVTERELTDNEERLITESLQKSLGHPFRIRFSYLDEIPRNAGGKFDTFISLVKAQV